MYCHSLTRLLTEITQLPGFLNLASQIVIDVYITVLLCHVLRQYTTIFARWVYLHWLYRTLNIMLYSRMNDVVERLTVYAIRRGVLLWYVSSGMHVTAFGMNNDMLYFSLVEVLCIALVGVLLPSVYMISPPFDLLVLSGQQKRHFLQRGGICTDSGL